MTDTCSVTSIDGDAAIRLSVTGLGGFVVPPPSPPVEPSPPVPPESLPDELSSLLLKPPPQAVNNEADIAISAMDENLANLLLGGRLKNPVPSSP
ncbi:Uncharacterised protein [BD1-7 clade bacterium]|uniref:Uncharacterized protein n=1 Tax=BD1-7 clade bacterium TaxID=2029982 RepID=A0A5S9QIF8_9GAMM|nr:Uncharacterised protein [BD1-7 clade bacterium]